MGDDISRKDDRESDDSVDNPSAISRKDDHSAYLKGDNEFPPVSNILSLLEEDTTGLDIWRDRNDGEGDSAHWVHIFWYSRHRGTLAHYEALNPLTETDLWGVEEADSMSKVITGPSDEEIDNMWPVDGDGEYTASTDMDDIVYSIMENHERRYPFRRTKYDAETLLSTVLVEDTDYFFETFEDLRDKLGITDDNIIAVEEYIINEETGYGGQADLVYEDPSGNTVIADLKTSSSLRHKHRLQTAAYKRGLEVCDSTDVDEVDRMEVIRISPDKEEYQVYSHERPDHIPEDAEWFDDEEFLVDAYGEFEYEDVDALWAQFESLAEEKHKYDDTGASLYE